MGLLGAVALALVSAIIGYQVTRKQEVDRIVQEGYLELQRLRDAPKTVRFRPGPGLPANAKVEFAVIPDELGDNEWRESVRHLKSLALYMRDDPLFGHIDEIEAALDGFVREAKSITMPSASRDSEQARHVQELNRVVPAAERRLDHWRGIRGILRALAPRRRQVRQRFVSR
ncbi:MAG: hypothetical protein KKA32_10450 [Actinobacteria bacterium]|nr:hypothetical protein [Actinomycetota bacterium]